MEAIGTGGTAIDLDRPLGGAHGMFLVLGLVLDPVQGKQVDLTGPRRVQLSVLVLLYQVCAATSLVRHFLRVEDLISGVITDSIMVVLICLRWKRYE